MSGINKLDQKSISKRPKASSSTRDVDIINKVKAFFGSSEDFTKAVNKFAEQHAYDYDRKCRNHNKK